MGIKQWWNIEVDMCCVQWSLLVAGKFDSGGVSLTNGHALLFVDEQTVGLDSDLLLKCHPGIFQLMQRLFCFLQTQLKIFNASSDFTNLRNQSVLHWISA